MTDKERLEEIKQYYSSCKALGEDVESDIHWLISTIEQQQKEIELLRADLELYKAKWQAQGLMIRKLHEEEARLREALKRIVNSGTYGTDIHSKEVVRSAEAKIAYQALEDKS